MTYQNVLLALIVAIVIALAIMDATFDSCDRSAEYENNITIGHMLVEGCK